MQKLEVGDELAYAVYFSNNGYKIHKIEKITPSGRITCGKYTLDPDLKVRGKREFNDPFRAVLVTDEIRENALRYEAVTMLAEMNRHSADKLTTDQLRQILAIVKGDVT